LRQGQIVLSIGAMAKSVADIIDKWPSQTELASDLGKKPNTVSKWRQRGRIPSEEWLPMCVAARKRQINLDVNTLARIAHSSGACS
jgi:hypothetical protein